MTPTKSRWAEIMWLEDNRQNTGDARVAGMRCKMAICHCRTRHCEVVRRMRVQKRKMRRAATKRANERVQRRQALSRRANRLIVARVWQTTRRLRGVKPMPVLRPFAGKRALSAVIC